MRVCSDGWQTHQPLLKGSDWFHGIIHIWAGDPTDRNVFPGLRDREEQFSLVQRCLKPRSGGEFGFMLKWFSDPLAD